MLEKLKLLQNKKILIPALVCLVVVCLVAKRNMAKPQTVATETVARVQVVKVIAKENTGSLLNTTTSLKAIADVVLKSKVETHLQG